MTEAGAPIPSQLTSCDGSCTIEISRMNTEGQPCIDTRYSSQ